MSGKRQIRMDVIVQVSSEIPGDLGSYRSSSRTETWVLGSEPSANMFEEAIEAVWDVMLNSGIETEIMKVEEATVERIPVHGPLGVRGGGE